MRGSRTFDWIVNSCLSLSPVARKSRLIFNNVDRCKECGCRLRSATGIPGSPLHDFIASQPRLKLQWTPRRFLSVLAAAESEITPSPLSRPKPSIPVQRLPDYSRAIARLSAQGRATDALSLYFKLWKDGRIPSQEALYQLTRSFYRQSNLAGLYAIHDTLLAYYKHIDTSKISRRQTRSLLYLYTMLINLIADKTKPAVDTKAIANLCGELAEYNLHGNIVLYNTLIRVLLEQGDHEGANAIFKDFIDQKIQPTVRTYSHLLDDSRRRRDLADFLHWMNDMEARAIEPDRVILSILVNTLCDVGQFDAATQLVQQTPALCRGDPRLLGKSFRKHLLQLIEKRRRVFLHKTPKKSNKSNKS